jgi:hypothetical protein
MSDINHGIDFDPPAKPEPLVDLNTGAHDNGWRPPVSFDEPEPRPEPLTPAAERLAAAEDRLLGEYVERHNGKPERGAGSRFAALHPTHKAHLAAIEHLIAVEAEHAAAEAHLNSVHAKVQHAMDRVSATEEASEAAAGKEA